MTSLLRTLLLLAALGPLCASAAGGGPKPYKAQYRAQFEPQTGLIKVELKLSGERLPSKLVLRMDPKRYRSISSTDALKVEESSVTWRPQGKFSRLKYDFVIDHQRSPGAYDSLARSDWALFRGDKLVPRAKVTALRGLESRASIEFVLPQGWSVVTPYAPAGTKVVHFSDPDRRFDRPEGWMLAGKLGSRTELIAGIQAIVAAPTGDSARRQDMLSFLNWNLPHLAEVFPNFPRRLLIVSAGDPMWRGGLSGPASLFLHAGRPLISENRTSTLLHELIHVAMSIHGDAESDWIVEGFAEFYSIETLRRSGGISSQRHAEALDKLATWGERTVSLFAQRSAGSRTARAVVTLKAADDEIRRLTGGKASLDDVARELAAHHGQVSLKMLQAIAAKVAGRPLQSLERSRLSGAAS